MNTKSSKQSGRVFRIERRDTGTVRLFSAPTPMSGHLQFAAMLNSLWEGPDPVEVLRWHSANQYEPARGPWVIEATSPTHGPHVYDVTVRGSTQSAAEILEHHMSKLGYEADKRARDLSHLLHQVFLEIAEDCDFTTSLEMRFGIGPDYVVSGVWSPACAPWDLDRFDDPAFDISMSWSIVPYSDSPEARQQIVDYLCSTIPAVAERLPVKLVHRPLGPAAARELRGDNWRSAVVRAVVENLVDRGLTVENDLDDLDDEELLTIRLDVFLRLVPDGDVDEDLDNEESEDDEFDDDDDLVSDEDDDEDPESIDDASDGGAGHVDADESAAEGDEPPIDDVPAWVNWIAPVPLSPDDLESVLQRMVAGASPEDALFTVTGSRTFPDPAA